MSPRKQKPTLYDAMGKAKRRTPKHRKSKGARDTSSRGGASRAPRSAAEVERSRRRFRVGIRVTIVALLATLVWVGLGRIRRYVDSLPRHQVLPAEVGAIADGAPWLSKDDVLAIRRVSTIERRLGIFHPELEAIVAEAWSRSPMVRRVRSVQKIYPNRVRVDLEIRRPIAAIFDPSTNGKRMMLVDRDGVRWPGVFDEIPTRFGDRILVLTGVDSASPEAGGVWDDRRVREGLAVAVDLARSMSDDLRRQTGIVAIDVTNVGTREPHRSEIVLRTYDDREIRWGRSSASPEAASELSVARKIEHVASAIDLYPKLRELKYIGVYSDRLFVRLDAD